MLFLSASHVGSVIPCDSDVAALWFARERRVALRINKCKREARSFHFSITTIIGQNINFSKYPKCEAWEKGIMANVYKKFTAIFRPKF